MRDELKRIAYRCKTSKQLEDALPQFAHHVPRPDAPLANLPVPTRLYDDLDILGLKPKVEKV